jgi:N-methylhydantoinase A/oxoprolinase/acetone carboxylase beta subunit
VRLGIDTGGTFTDAVDDSGRAVKVLSTRDDPARAVGRAVAALASGAAPDLLAHGTTVATNALLERRGAPVALVTTRGFADVIEIARQARPSLYDAFADRPPPLVERDRRYEVSGRLDAAGRVVEEWQGDLPDLPAEIEAVAVCLLHADLDDRHERAVAAALRARGADVSASHEISPEFREYERVVTTVANAYLRPVCGPYLDRLAALASEVLVMTSAGGLVSVHDAARAPASLLLSGPAAGVRAGALVAAACGFPDAVTFDMGGTSTDVCLVRGGVPEPAPELAVGGLPIRLPAVAVHTIGAGGGSIARLDPGGALVVGPRSAAADPGPACYGRGGSEPTVTDADLALGRIPVDATFGDLGALDRDAAHVALASAGIDAAGVVAVVDAEMERAVRAVTVARGVDPRELALVAFGGAGPLHACAIAGALGMRAVVVPPRAGVLSAVGLLGAPRRQEVVHTLAPGAELSTAIAAVAEEARRRVGPDAAVETAVDCRYVGQSHELTVAAPADFPAEHERRNGHARPGAAVEVVAVRARASRRSPVDLAAMPVPERATVVGPAVIVEPDCTVWVPEGWIARPAALGAWVVQAP